MDMLLLLHLESRDKISSGDTKNKELLTRCRTRKAIEAECPLIIGHRTGGMLAVGESGLEF